MGLFINVTVATVGVSQKMANDDIMTGEGGWTVGHSLKRVLNFGQESNIRCFVVSLAHMRGSQKVASDDDEGGLLRYPPKMTTLFMNGRG